MFYLVLAVNLWFHLLGGSLTLENLSVPLRLVILLFAFLVSLVALLGLRAPGRVSQPAQVPPSGRTGQLDQPGKTGGLKRMPQHRLSRSLRLMCSRESAPLLILFLLPLQLLLPVLSRDRAQLHIEGIQRQLNIMTGTLELELRCLEDSRRLYDGSLVTLVRLCGIRDSRGLAFDGSCVLQLGGHEQRLYRGMGLSMNLPGATGIYTVDLSAWEQMGVHGRLRGDPMIQGFDSTSLEMRALLAGSMDRGLQILDPLSRAWIGSLVLGDRSDLGVGVSDLFRDAGVMHVIVLSGMHLAIIYAAARMLLPSLIPRKLRDLLSLLAVWSFIWFIGAGASAWRAAIAISLAALMESAGIRLSRELLFMLIWTLMLLLRPRWAFDPGLYLSFAAVWGLSAFIPVLEDSTARVSWHIGRSPGALVRLLVNGSLVPSIAAQAAVSPVAVILFSNFSPQGIISLLPLMPPFFLSFALSGLLLLLSFGPESWLPLIVLLDRILVATLHWMVAILHPFALLGRRIQGLSGSLVIWILVLAFCGPLFIRHCYPKGGMLCSSHVRLRLGIRHPRSPGRGGHRHAEALRPELHDQPPYAAEDRETPGSAAG